MRNLLCALRPLKSPKSPSRTVRRARLELEHLEERQMLTVTAHGGPVLSSVDVQALYYGSDWANYTTYYNQAGYLGGFLSNIVDSPFMDMLSTAGYGVGRGINNVGWIDRVSLDKTRYLMDSQIQSVLAADIGAGHLRQPNANRLYVVFVEDGVAVKRADGSNSQTNWSGYHNSFISNGQTIRYAAQSYPGAVGVAGGNNVNNWWVSVLGQMTLTVSHELAEAATDPDWSLGRYAWYDDSRGGEVGDICDGWTVYMNGYAVQRIADKNDQAMTPVNATAISPMNFVLTTYGDLFKIVNGSWTFLAGGVASVSDQGIDNQGRALVDFVTYGGDAYEVHSMPVGDYLLHLNILPVRVAKAGQGVSYLLYQDGAVWEYKDADASWTRIGNNVNVASIDAGTDKYGVNMMVEVWYGRAWEWSDTSGWHYRGHNIAAVSVGRQGIIDLLYMNGVAYSFSEATQNYSYLSSNVVQVTAGIDQYGNSMTDLLSFNGALVEYRAGSGWTYLDSWVQSISKAHAGMVDIVFSWGDAYAHDSWGWYYLLSHAQTAA
jgi:hypothetical protein